jgi:Type II intron maturase/Reverse transcriptase (RNA-dependent DNA polymerase)
VVSPVLSNIYLHRFDQWVETSLIPDYTRGAKQRPNPAYQRMTGQLYRLRKRGATEGIKELVKQRRELPSVDPRDEGYRRLRYVRYADDFLLGLTGAKEDAEAIKQRLKDWLAEQLKLKLSEEKTLVTQASTQAARFLGYDIKVQRANDYLDPLGRRGVNGMIGLYVPAEVIEAKCARYLRKGKTIHRAELLNDSDFTIVATYQAEYRGLVQYYLLALNATWLTKLHWIMEGSLLKTLAAKHRARMQAMKQKYSATTTDQRTGKTLQCLEVRVARVGKPPLIARWGGLSLSHQPHAAIDDRPYQVQGGRTELLQRLLADECELCGATEKVEVHHIRKLADLKKSGKKAVPRWVELMAARRRKTLIVCRNCHEAIHQGVPTGQQKTE